MELDIIVDQVSEKLGITKDQAAEFLKLKTWSGRIRFLTAHGLGDATIAKFLGKRQQHVRSVRLKPVVRPREK